MKYNFETFPDRKGTGALKWQKYEGQDILPFWVADMDFVAAPEILDALHHRVDHGVIGYTKPYTEANDEVVAYLKRAHNLDIESEWLYWIPGMVQGLLITAMAYAEPGEGVMTMTPIYPPFRLAGAWAGRKLVEVDLVHEEGRWTFDWAAMEAAVQPDTKVFLLCNPHNPVGRVFSKAEIEKVVAFCIRHQLVLCSDEIHCDLILDDVDHFPTLALGEETHPFTFAMMAASKTYNLPGLACAYCIIPDAKLRMKFQRAARGIVTEINAFGHTGTIAAYRHGEAWRGELLDVLRRNRDVLYDFVEDELAPLKILPMEATYLAWIDARDLAVDDPIKFFEQHGVGLSGGADFGWPGYVRINFGCPTELLKQGLERMKAAILSLG